jgi:very-short-patch-repair endonuclease
MPRITNHPRLKINRQNLRRDQSSFEAFLWSKLRSRKLGGYKFYRQFSFGPYILDFYCQEKRLSIELDGGQHLNDEVEIYDKQRTEYLVKYGITVRRFWNFQVKEDIDGVLEKILALLQE